VSAALIKARAPYKEKALDCSSAFSFGAAETAPYDSIRRD